MFKGMSAAKLWLSIKWFDIWYAIFSMIYDVFQWYHSILYSTCLLRVSQSLNVFLPRCCPWADSKPGEHGKHSLHVFTPLHWVPFPVNSSGQLMVCNLAPEQVELFFIITRGSEYLRLEVKLVPCFGGWFCGDTLHACLTLKFVGQVSKQVLVSVHHCFCLEDGNKTWLNEVSPDSNFFLAWHGLGASGTNSDLKSGMYWGSRIGSHVGGIFHFLAKLGLVLFAVSLWRLAEECQAIKDKIWSPIFTFLTLPHVFIWESIFCKISLSLSLLPSPLPSSS